MLHKPIFYLFFFLLLFFFILAIWSLLELIVSNDLDIPSSNLTFVYELC